MYRVSLQKERGRFAPATPPPGPGPDASAKAAGPPVPGRPRGGARCPPEEGTATSRPPEPAGRPLPPAAVTGRWAHPQAPARRRRLGPARRTAAPWRRERSSCKERLRALKSSGAARLPCAGSTASPAGSAAGQERGEADGNQGSGTGAGNGKREVREAGLPPARVRGSSAQAPRGGAAALSHRGGARGRDSRIFFLFLKCVSIYFVLLWLKALC